MSAEKYYKYFGKRFIFDSHTLTQRKKEINIIKMLLSKKKHILDLGCGGVIPILLALENYEIVGIDINKTFIQSAKNIIRKLNLQHKLKLIWGDIKKVDRILKRMKKAFDVVMLWNNVISHLSYWDLNQLVKSLREYTTYFLISYTDTYKLFIEEGYKYKISKPLDKEDLKGLTSISIHKSYNEREGSFERLHIIRKKRHIADKFRLKIYIWSPSLLEFLMNMNQFKLIKRVKKRFPISSYEFVIDLYKKI